MQRVSDEELAAWAKAIAQEPYIYGLSAPEGREFARRACADLRAARTRLAVLEPVVRAAVAWSEDGSTRADRALIAAVAALPKELRKELGDG